MGLPPFCPDAPYHHSHLSYVPQRCLSPAIFHVPPFDIPLGCQCHGDTFNIPPGPFVYLAGVAVSFCACVNLHTAAFTTCLYLTRPFHLLPCSALTTRYLPHGTICSWPYGGQPHLCAIYGAFTDAFLPGWTLDHHHLKGYNRDA